MPESCRKIVQPIGDLQEKKSLMHGRKDTWLRWALPTALSPSPGADSQAAHVCEGLTQGRTKGGPLGSRPLVLRDAHMSNSMDTISRLSLYTSD